MERAAIEEAVKRASQVGVSMEEHAAVAAAVANAYVSKAAAAAEEDFKAVVGLPHSETEFHIGGGKVIHIHGDRPITSWVQIRNICAESFHPKLPTLDEKAVLARDRGSKRRGARTADADVSSVGTGEGEGEGEGSATAAQAFPPRPLSDSRGSRRRSVARSG